MKTEIKPFKPGDIVKHTNPTSNYGELVVINVDRDNGIYSKEFLITARNSRGEIFKFYSYHLELVTGARFNTWL